mgnify:CR=1 FL=1
MSKIAISQPTYLSWLGYFQQISQVDCFVFLDNVQFDRRSWQCRNRIKDHNGNLIWLTVPVVKTDRNARISDINLSDNWQTWKIKHISTIRNCLINTPYLAEVLDVLDSVYSKPFTRIADLNIEIIKTVTKRLGILTPFLRASDLNIQGNKAELLLKICKQLGANQYYANQGSKIYLEAEKHMFLDENIEIHYQEFMHPIYQQRGDCFTSHLAWPDAICYQGFDAKKLQLI